jgi:hypothetical protein
MSFRAEDLMVKIHVEKNQVAGFGFQGCGDDPSFMINMRLCGPTNPPIPPIDFEANVENEANFEKIKADLKALLAHMDGISKNTKAKTPKPVKKKPVKKGNNP